MLCKIREALGNAVGIDHVRVKVVGHPFLAFDMALVPRISNGFEGFDITWRTADVFRRAPPGGFQEARIELAEYGISKAFDLDGMLPAIPEVVEITQGLCAGVFNNFVEPGPARIQRPAGPIG